MEIKETNKMQRTLQNIRQIAKNYKFIVNESSATEKYLSKLR